MSDAVACEGDRMERLRDRITEQYQDHPTGCGGSFDELLCYEIHETGLTFRWLAEKWGISVGTLGLLIWDHCIGLEELPRVDHDYRSDLTEAAKRRLRPS